MICFFCGREIHVPLPKHLWLCHLPLRMSATVRLCWCGRRVHSLSIFESHLEEAGGAASHYLACHLGGDRGEET